MGQMKSQARGLNAAGKGAPVAEDPFAELAEIFETELKFDSRFAETTAQARRPVATPRGTRQEPAVDFDAMDAQFQTAFETDFAAARPQAARAAAMPRKVGRAQPTHLTDEEIDGELEEVLRNLSAPARPRDRIVVETQSFAPERTVEERVQPVQQFEVDEFEELIRSELAVIRPSVATRAPVTRAPVQAVPQDVYASELPFDGDFDDLDPPGHHAGPASASKPWKRRLTIGASAAAILLVAGVGVASWQGASTGLSSGDQAFLIKADSEPFKIQPKDPGGRAYPNQNKAVYDRVASPGKPDDTPIQKALITNVEEPMDIPAEDEPAYADSLPGVELGDKVGEEAKDDIRVSEATETTDEATGHALTPRKVKTMSVRPDGRLVMADAPVAADAKTAPPAADPIEVAALSAPAAVPAPAPAPAAAAPVPAPTTAPAPVREASLASEPARAPMPAGGFFVQVASQPSEAAAQQSMRAFGTRYGAVVGARPVGIQSADIPGKGTFWRVRVAASTKEEAGAVCSELKSAGASCFVTR